jgi:hypothetical protein
VLHLFAALAEKERALISTRTRQAFSAAKALLVTLGNPRLHEARENAVGAVKAEADRYAANVLPIIREAQKAGARTLREIAEVLNAPRHPNGAGWAMVCPDCREYSPAGLETGPLPVEPTALRAPPIPISKIASKARGLPPSLQLLCAASGTNWRRTGPIGEPICQRHQCLLFLQERRESRYRRRSVCRAISGLMRCSNCVPIR